MNNKLKYLRYYFNIASILYPFHAAKHALNLFSKVSKREIKKREERFYQIAEQYEISYSPEPIVYYRLGDLKGELVLLVHGWTSIPAAFTDIALNLAQEGYQVLAITLPGHGESKYPSTNIVQCGKALSVLLNEIDPKKPFSVLTHSFGSVVVPFVMSKSIYKLDKIVMVNNPGELSKIFADYAKLIGLNAKASRQMIIQINNILGEDIEEVSVAKKLSQTKFNKALLIHDKEDKIAPYQNSVDIIDTVANTQLYTTEGAGHSRLLCRKDVLDKISSFLGN